MSEDPKVGLLDNFIKLPTAQKVLVGTIVLALLGAGLGGGILLTSAQVDRVMVKVEKVEVEKVGLENEIDRLKSKLDNKNKINSALPDLKNDSGSLKSEFDLEEYSPAECSIISVHSKDRSYVSDSIEEIIEQVEGINDIKSIESFDKKYKNKWVRIRAEVNFRGGQSDVRSVIPCGHPKVYIFLKSSIERTIETARDLTDGSIVTLDARFESYAPRFAINLNSAEFVE